MGLKAGTQSCPNCGRYCGRTFASKNEEMFLTENKNPHNGGYTQQNINVTTQYTNLGDAQLENPDDDIFFSTKKLRTEKPANDNTSTSEDYTNLSGDSADNLYHDISVTTQNNDIFTGVLLTGSGKYADYHIYGEEKPYTPPSDGSEQNQAHTEEFMPENIVEFSRHFKVRALTKKINTNLIKLTAISVLLLIVTILEVCFRGASILVIPAVIANTSVCTAFLTTTKKTYSKNITIAAALYTFLFSIVAAFMVNNIIEVAHYTFVVVSIFGIIIRQDVLFMHLISRLFKYNDAWEDYQLSNKNKE